MEKLILFLDILIAILSLWVLYKLTAYSGLIGKLGKSLSLIGYGVVVIGLSQFVETVGLNFLDFGVSNIEITHRLILFVGLIFIAWGFGDLMEKK